MNRNHIGCVFEPVSGLGVTVRTLCASGGAPLSAALCGSGLVYDAVRLLTKSRPFRIKSESIKRKYGTM